MNRRRPAIFESVLVPPAVAIVIGALGTLLTPKRTGLLKSIRPELDALLGTSFFLNPKLYDELLRAAREIDS